MNELTGFVKWDIFLEFKCLNYSGVAVSPLVSQHRVHRLSLELGSSFCVEVVFCRSTYVYFLWVLLR